MIENTMFIPQGYVLEVDRSAEWSMKPYDDGIDKLARGLNKDDLYHGISKSVQQQLVSDVPIGSFVSGGIDSMLVTECASLSPTKEPFKGYTIAVEDEFLNEAEQAKALVSLLPKKINHSVKLVKDESIVQALEWYNNSLAEPLGDFSSLLMLQVCYKAKKDVTVVLSGDGGDELFFGYKRFATAQKYLSLFDYGYISRTVRTLKSRFTTHPIPFSILRYKSFGDFYLSKQGVTGNKRAVNMLLKKPSVHYKPFHYRNLISKSFSSDRSLEKHRSCMPIHA